MHRIDTPNRAIDLWGAGKPGWRDGNKALGVNPTEFNALFMNAMQEELAAVIEAASMVLDPANNAQLLAALRGVGVFQTPAQFDNSTKVATTNFAMSIGMRVSTTNAPASGYAMSAADIGKLTELDSAGAANITLPAIAGLPVGAIVCLSCLGSGSWTVNKGAGGTYIVAQGGYFTTSIVLNNGDSIMLSLDSSGNWVQVAGTGNFSSSIGSPGYQKLPSGLIVQWGSILNSSSGATTVTYPVAFPNGVFSVVNTAISNSMGSAQLDSTPTVSSFASSIWNFSNARIGNYSSWIAIGH